jgi:hypothetical protein
MLEHKANENKHPLLGHSYVNTIISHSQVAHSFLKPNIPYIGSLINVTAITSRKEPGGEIHAVSGLSWLQYSGWISE